MRDLTTKALVGTHDDSGHIPTRRRFQAIAKSRIALTHQHPRRAGLFVTRPCCRQLSHHFTEHGPSTPLSGFSRSRLRSPSMLAFFGFGMRSSPKAKTFCGQQGMHRAGTDNAPLLQLAYASHSRGSLTPSGRRRREEQRE